MIARQEHRRIREKVGKLRERGAMLSVGRTDDEVVELWFKSQSGEIIRQRRFWSIDTATKWLEKLDGIIVDMIEAPYGRGKEDSTLQRMISARVI